MNGIRQELWQATSTKLPLSLQPALYLNPRITTGTSALRQTESW